MFGRLIKPWWRLNNIKIFAYCCMSAVRQLVQINEFLGFRLLFQLSQTGFHEPSILDEQPEALANQIVSKQVYQASEDR